MKCPRDGATLTPVTVADIELDKCHHCDGLWFDRGELERIAKLDRTDVEQQLEQRYGNPEVGPGRVDGYMRCPRCPEGRLQQLTYTLEKQVKIDRCDTCLGVWVDDSELDAILGEKKKLEQVADSRPLRALLRAVASVVPRGK